MKGNEKMKVVNLIEQKQNELNVLKEESTKALDMVTSTIDRLSKTNEKIVTTINEIKEAKSKLENTEKELNQTHSSNTKIIEKFAALIEF